MKVTVYTTSACPFCDMLEEYLKEKGVDYEEKKVDESNEVRAEMSEKSDGFLGVPFTFIVKEDGTSEGVIGFDKNKINSIIGIE